VVDTPEEILSSIVAYSMEVMSVFTNSSTSKFSALRQNKSCFNREVHEFVCTLNESEKI